MSEQLKYKVQLCENYQISCHEQLKILSSLITLIQEINDSEERHQKSLDKIWQQQTLNSNKQGFQKFFDIVIDNLQSKQRLTLEYVGDMRHQMDAQKDIILKQQQTLKKYQEEIKKHDQFCSSNFSLIDKIKEKYYQSSKEYEEGIFQLGSSEKNLECTEIVKQKLCSRIQILYQQKHEQEKQYIVQIGQHTKAANNFETQIQEINDDFQCMELQRMTSFQDFILKIELSQQQLNSIEFLKRTENISKIKECVSNLTEIEGYDPLKIYSTDKIYYNIQKQVLNQSYLTELSNQIVRESIKKGQLNIQLGNPTNPSTDPLDLCYSEELKSAMHKLNQQLFDFYESAIPQDWQDIISRQADEEKQHNKLKIINNTQKSVLSTENTPKNVINSDLFQMEASGISNIEFQEIKIQEMISSKQEPTLEQTDEQQISTLNQENIPQIFQNNDEISQNIMFIIHNILIHTHPLTKLNVSNFVQERLCILFKQTLYFEISVFMIQSFRTFKKENLSNLGFKNLGDILALILDSCNSKKDTRNARKLMLMSFTIYTIYPEKPDQKIFIQEQVRKHPMWLQIQLWESMIFDTIDEILAGTNKNKNNQQNFQQNSLIFSNILSIGQSMLKFKITKSGLSGLLTKYARYFGLFDIQIQEIHRMIDADSKNNKSMFMSGPSSVQILNTFYQQQPGVKKETQSQVKAPLTQSRKLDFNIIKK